MLSLLALRARITGMAAAVIVKRRQSSQSQALNMNTIDPETDSFVENLPPPENREMDTVVATLLLG